MEKYDYRAHMIQDIKEYVEANKNIQLIDPLYEDDSIIDRWYDMLWDVDEVTGNGCFYYASEDECCEYIAKNFDLAFEACDELYVEYKKLKEKAAEGYLARYLDCTIRCYLLGECIEQAFKEMGYEV